MSNIWIKYWCGNCTVAHTIKRLGGMAQQPTLQHPHGTVVSYCEQSECLIYMGTHRHRQGRHLPPGGEHLLPESRKLERQPPWTNFWAFFRCANASKLSASGGFAP